eukprot:1186699-Prorocentrum_minimum.AAC.2
MANSAVVSTLGGTGEEGYRDGEGNAAQFYNPYGVAVDGDGNGLVSTLAGTGKKGHRDGEGTVAQFRSPRGVAVVHGDNSVIVADMDNNRIRKISPQGLVSTLAGTGARGHRDGEGTAVAQFNGPVGVEVDGEGNIIVADLSNNRIRKISPQGLVSTLAGTGEEGRRDGEGTTAQFNFPNDVAVDREGNVIVADTLNHRIRKISL